MTRGQVAVPPDGENFLVQENGPSPQICQKKLLLLLLFSISETETTACEVRNHPLAADARGVRLSVEPQTRKEMRDV